MDDKIARSKKVSLDVKKKKVPPDKAKKKSDLITESINDQKNVLDKGMVAEKGPNYQNHRRQ